MNEYCYGVVRGEILVKEKNQGYFSDDLFAFLHELSLNNNRKWFAENKIRYENSVKKPALSFIEAFAPLLHRISPCFQALPKAQGGSLFRIYRDTRFSPDKTPYKTHTGMQFRHQTAKDAHAPGFYVHLSPGGLFFGAGLWHPDSPTTKAIRMAIASKTQAWKKCKSSTEGHGLILTGESLKRPPRGFDASHPAIEDIKRKDFIVTRSFTRDDVLASDFPERIASMCTDSVPIMKFLCRAVDLPF